MNEFAHNTRESPGAPSIPLIGSIGESLLRDALERLAPGLSTVALREAYADWLAHLARSPEKLAALVGAAAGEAMRFGLYALRATVDPRTPACLEPGPHDRRFLGEAWRRWPFNLTHQSFLLIERWLLSASTNVPGLSKHHQDVVSFATRQILDVLSPANFPFANPEILAATRAQRGANLRRGANNLVEDWRRVLAGRRPVGAETFVPGQTVAVTPGKVVYRNNLIEVIQYAPTTPTVYPEPVLLIPAWILKYYILDLSPHNSLVRYLVDHGHTVFVMSWKNPTEEDRALGFDDYRTLGLMAALDAASAIVPDHRVHAVGYCLGGTLLALAAAAMARDGDHRLRTVTLFAAQVDFTEAGELSTFIDADQIASLENVMRAQGYLDTRQLVVPVLLLRAREFLWPLVLRQYLLGEREPMTDLMAWRTDATRLPCRMYAECLRRLFLANDLAEGRYEVNGRPVRVGDLTVPIFVVGAVDDFVAPWRSVYEIHRLADTDVTFVLTSGDHHTGVIMDPSDPHRNFQVVTTDKEEAAVDAETWRTRAALRQGFWWPEWEAWLVRHSGERMETPAVGAAPAGYAPLCDAPGTYVMQN